jgi:hypothetical protein
VEVVAPRHERAVGFAGRLNTSPAAISTTSLVAAGGTLVASENELVPS